MCEECAELRLENAALRFERDYLLAQREGTRAWLGELVQGSPIELPDDPWVDPLIALADRLVAQYPDNKIVAIKEMRTKSAALSDGMVGLGLKEAKDAIDAAFQRFSDIPF